MPSSHLILCHSLLFLPSIFPSIRVFSNLGLLHCRQILYHLSHQGSPLEKTDRKLDFSSVQFSRSVMSDALRPHESPGLPVHHQLLKFTQTHVHRVGDAIQPSHPLSSPSPPAPNPSQHQGLFQRVNSLHEVAKVLEFQLQHQSFQ